jgi:hypothetical protein
MILLRWRGFGYCQQGGWYVRFGSPLLDACYYGGDLKKAALLLLADADVNGRGGEEPNFTPLQFASCYGMVDHVRLL